VDHGLLADGSRVDHGASYGQVGHLAPRFPPHESEVVDLHGTTVVAEVGSRHGDRVAASRRVLAWRAGNGRLFVVVG